MAGIEEMTRRRDAWREKAESAADEIRGLRLALERAGEALARKEGRCASLADQLKEARAESAANLKWVRALQRDVEHWKHNSKMLARAFMRGTPGKITPWVGPISMCPVGHVQPRSCADPGHTHVMCLAHWHCDMCGAIRCHSGWWRPKVSS